MNYVNYFPLANPVAQSTQNPRWMFAQAPPAPFYQYAAHPPPRSQQQTVPVPTASGSGSNSSSPSSNDHGVSQCRASSTAVTSKKDQNGAKSKWSETQSSVLVSEWKEKIDEVESARATETWHKIAEEVNKVGSPKTIKQCKDKLRNLKQSYKEAKGNNNKIGRPLQTSPFYDSFDKVLGTRAVVTMPGVIQCGQQQPEESSLE